MGVLPGGRCIAGDLYPYNLMLLAVGGIMQWLAMIAILVAQNAQGNVQDKQVEHLHDLGVTTHKLVVENTHGGFRLRSLFGSHG